MSDVGKPSFQVGDRVELRKDERSPWAETGKIVGTTLPGADTGHAEAWMVRIDGLHGVRPIAAGRIRLVPVADTDPP